MPAAERMSTFLKIPHPNSSTPKIQGLDYKFTSNRGTVGRLRLLRALI